MNGLIPPDFDHCQAEITPSHSFMTLGPKPKPHQCNATPVYLAVEVVAGTDGLCGSMSLCFDCARVLLEDAGLRSRVQLQPIIRQTEEVVCTSCNGTGVVDDREALLDEKPWKPCPDCGRAGKVIKFDCPEEK